ncbi:MAG: hydrogenase maturation nickel metallochaperone HypA [Acidobacteria bacterium]|nr:hydrogenase maturation nickel metallochaperone HypA [Acidobacteriota bacterium]
MHEVSVARDILETALETVQPYPHTRVTAVRVKVGPLSNVLPDALLFAWEAVVEESGLAGAELVIDETSVSAQCGSCREDFPVDDYQFSCPYCGSRQITVVSGDELEIIDVEVEYVEGYHQA